LEHALGEVLGRADAAGGDDRDADRVAHRAGEAEVEAVARAVAIDAGEENFARARRFHALRPFDRIEAGGLAPAVGEHLPAFAGRSLLGVDGDDDALAADHARGLLHERRVLHRGGVDGHLVGAGIEEAPHVSHLAHAAAHRERDEDARGDGLDDAEQDVALVGARRDVEEGDLVGPLLVVARGDLDRVARVAQADEVHALHHPPGGDVEAGNDALGERHGEVSGAGRAQAPFFSAWSAAACAFFRSSLPSYSARPAMVPMTPSGTSFSQIVFTSSRLFSPPEAMTGVLIACVSLSVASML